MSKEAEDYFLNPPPGSAAARAVDFGIDLTLTLHNLRLTPEERIRQLDDFIAGIAYWCRAKQRRLRLHEYSSEWGDFELWHGLARHLCV